MLSRPIENLQKKAFGNRRDPITETLLEHRNRAQGNETSLALAGSFNGVGNISCLDAREMKKKKTQSAWCQTRRLNIENHERRPDIPRDTTPKLPPDQDVATESRGTRSRATGTRPRAA